MKYVQRIFKICFIALDIANKFIVYLHAWQGFSVLFWNVSEASLKEKHNKILQTDWRFYVVWKKNHWSLKCGCSTGVN